MRSGSTCEEKWYVKCLFWWINNRSHHTKCSVFLHCNSLSTSYQHWISICLGSSDWATTTFFCLLVPRSRFSSPYILTQVWWAVWNQKTQRFEKVCVLTEPVLVEIWSLERRVNARIGILRKCESKAGCFFSFPTKLSPFPGTVPSEVFLKV